MRIQNAIAPLLLTALSTASMANNGVTEVTFEEPRRFFVDCLAEYVAGTIYVTAKGHFFETSSGVVHIVDNWKYTLAVTGESTGQTWVSRSGTSPLTDNIFKVGEVVAFTDTFRMHPLDDGQKWRFIVNFKARFNAEGNLVSEFAKAPTGERIRCLGPAD